MRNKLLWGTSALAVAAVMGVGDEARAQFTVTVGGYSEVQWGYVDSDRNLAVDNDFRNDTEIQVTARAKADNGLTYGVIAQIEFTGAAGTGFDETRLFVAGSWGEIQLGDDDGASDVLAVFAPTVGIGQIDGAAGDYSTFGNFAQVKAIDSSDATKISYFTPSFAGFQAGVSYAAQNAGGDQSLTAGGVPTGYENFVEAGANYRTEFAGFGILIGGGLSWAEGNNTGVGATLVTRDDILTWQVGAQASYAGFTVGGGWVEGDDTVVSTLGGVNRSFDRAWNVGASYAQGPYAVAISYNDVDYNTADASLLGVGFQYTIAPGLLLRGDYYYVDAELTGAADVEENIFVIGARVNF
jgi:hypothetical protein